MTIQGSEAGNRQETILKTKDFTTTILVERTPQEVFDAVNDVRGWWSGEIEGRTDVLGAEFTYSYKQVHRTTQKITELVPGKKVVWHVTASQLSFVRDKSEWDGTDIVFEIAEKGDKTEVRFTHVGLVPGIECYDGCSGAWAHVTAATWESTDWGVIVAAYDALAGARAVAGGGAQPRDRHLDGDRTHRGSPSAEGARATARGLPSLLCGSCRHAGARGGGPTARSRESAFARDERG